VTKSKILGWVRRVEYMNEIRNSYLETLKSYLLFYVHAILSENDF